MEGADTDFENLDISLLGWFRFGDEAELLAGRGQPAGALAAYRRSLEAYPHRFNSLVGAARAARASGDEALARRYYAELLEVAHGGTRQSILSEARQYATQLR
jgi:uncharacterized protein HemY